MLKVQYKKLRLSSKGNLKRIIGNGVPVLSIFALLGISIYMLNATSFNLIAIIDPTNSNNQAYAAESAVNDTTSASLIIDNGSIIDKVSVARGDIAYASHKVKISANDIEGYSLTITGPTKLTGSTVISGAGNKTPTNMANNTWGYSWGAENATESTMTYQSFTGNAQNLETNTSITNNSVNLTKKLAFAAKFSSDASEGHYTATVGLNLTVTPKKVASLAGITYMQEVTSEVCAVTPIGNTQYTLTDSRDSKTYTVARLKDGNCWMTQDLAFAVTKNTTIKASDTDLTENWNNTYGVSYPVTNGMLYDYDTATAGSADTSYDSFNCGHSEGEAPSSICPKGWKLPTGGSGGQFDILFGDVTLAQIKTTPYNINLAGYGTWNYPSQVGISEAGSVGVYWSSTGTVNPRSRAPAPGCDESSPAYTLAVTSDGVFADGDEPGRTDSKYSIRCIAVSN